MAALLGDIEDDDDDFEEAHEINVTPFIDVMLVLLIIFMVAAPLSTVDLPVDLPSSTAMPQKKPDKPTYVTIKSDLAVAIGETPVKRVDLVRSLDAMSDAGQGPPHLPACGSRGALWRIDGRAGAVAHRRLQQNCTGGARRRPRRFDAIACAGIASRDEQRQSAMSDHDLPRHLSRTVWVAGRARRACDPRRLRGAGVRLYAARRCRRRSRRAGD